MSRRKVPDLVRFRKTNVFARVSSAVRVNAVSISKALVDGCRGGRLGGRCRVRVFCWFARAQGRREMRKKMIGRREKWSKRIFAIENVVRERMSYVRKSWVE